MKNEKKYFKHCVNHALNDRFVLNKSRRDGLAEACVEEYHQHIKEGLNEKTARTKTLSSLNETMDEYYGASDLPKTGSAFALGVSVISLIVFVIQSLVGAFLHSVYPDFAILYPTLFFLSLALLIYVGCTYWRRKPIDYVVTGLLFVSLLIINLELVPHLYDLWVDSSLDLYWLNPFLLEYWKEDTEAVLAIFFDPTPIAVFLNLIGSIVFYILDYRKKQSKTPLVSSHGKTSPEEK